MASPVSVLGVVFFHSSGADHLGDDWSGRISFKYYSVKNLFIHHLAGCLVNIADLRDFKLDRKKFRKQIKRAHCYLRKLRHVVREDAVEQKRYYDDLGF